MTRYSSDFTNHKATINGTELFYRKGGPEHGSAVLLLHGHTQTSDMWAPLANILTASGYQVIAIDLHGLGRSSQPPSRWGYSKKEMAADFHQLIVELLGEQKRVAVIGHDSGVFAAYAYAAQFQQDVSHLALLDATLPGIGIWPMLLQQSRTWHFFFWSSCCEAGRGAREGIS